MSTHPVRWRVIFLQVCTLSLVVTVIFFFYSSPHLFANWKIRSCNVLPGHHHFCSSVEPVQRNKLVLLWTPYYGRSDWLPSTTTLQCPVPYCNVTSHRSSLRRSSAVIIHWRDLDPENVPPALCEAEHCPLLVLFNKESPSHTSRHTLAPLANKIHLTATYKRDSDIYAPYGKIVKREGSWNMPVLNPNRTLICWLVSNCKVPSHREAFVKTYLSVDTYGGCGAKRCPFSDTFQCYEWLSRRCKFYLAFENSICKDYATEKLYNTLRTDMVPVVLGGENYTAHFPARSYINALDFRSPEDLARYLLILGRNEKLYLEYFRWKYKFTAVDASYKWFCDLCAVLHNETLKRIRPREDVVSWWYREDCTPLESVI